MEFDGKKQLIRQEMFVTSTRYLTELIHQIQWISLERSIVENGLIIRVIATISAGEISLQIKFSKWKNQFQRILFPLYYCLTTPNSSLTQFVHFYMFLNLAMTILLKQ